MRALRIAGMVVGSPLAMLGFMLPLDGAWALVGTMLGMAGQSHGFIIIIGH